MADGVCRGRAVQEWGCTGRRKEEQLPIWYTTEQIHDVSGADAARKRYMAMPTGRGARKPQCPKTSTAVGQRELILANLRGGVKKSKEQPGRHGGPWTGLVMRWTPRWTGGHVVF